MWYKHADNVPLLQGVVRTLRNVMASEDIEMDDANTIDSFFVDAFDDAAALNPGGDFAAMVTEQPYERVSRRTPAGQIMDGLGDLPTLEADSHFENEED